MATFNDVQTDPIGGFLGGVLNSDKQHYSDLNKQQDLMTDALNNVKLKTTVSEFLRDAPTREAEDQLKMAQARAKLPMVQEMLNADLEGKKAEAAYKRSHGGLFDRQANALDYTDSVNRISAINEIIRKLPPEQALEMRVRMNPVLQGLLKRMTGRPDGEFVGSNELEATAAAGINNPDHQRALDKKLADYERALAIAKQRGDDAQQVAIIRAIGGLMAAGARGAGKVDKNSWESRYTRVMTLPVESRIGAMENMILDAPEDVPASRIAAARRQLEIDRRILTTKPSNAPPGSTGGIDTGVPKAQQGDLPPGVERIGN